MAAGTSPIFEKAATEAGQQFTSADASAKKTIVTGGAEGTRVDSLMISTNDTAAVNLACYLNNGATDFYIGNVQVPAGSGYTTIARVEGLVTLAPLTGYLIVPNGWTLKMNCVATMTAAKTTDVVAMGGDF